MILHGEMHRKMLRWRRLELRPIKIKQQQKIVLDQKIVPDQKIAQVQQKIVADKIIIKDKEVITPDLQTRHFCN